MQLSPIVTTTDVLLLASQMVERLIAGKTQETFWVSSTAIVVLQQMAITTGRFADSSFAIPVLKRLTAVIDTVAEPGDRAKGLATLAAAYTRLGQSQVGDDFTSLSSVATAATQLDNPDHSAAILERVLVVVESAEPATQASTYIAVADAYSELGHGARSQNALTLAMDAIEQISDPLQRYIQLANIPVRAVELSDGNVTYQLLQRVFKQIGTIEDEERRVSLLGYLSSALDSWPQSRLILEQAYPSLNGLSDPSNKVKGLVAIATAYAQLTSEQPDLIPQVLELLDQAIVLLPTLKANESYLWSRRLRDIFFVYRDLGTYDQGYALLDQLTLEQSDEITQSSSRDEAIHGLKLQGSIAEGAILLNSPQHFQTALDSVHGIANLWSLD